MFEDNIKIDVRWDGLNWIRIGSDTGRMVTGQ
jgi:hypothetical protein